MSFAFRPRHALFLFFCLLFLATAPLFVLTTAGYRYAPGIGLLKTGTLSVTTSPRGAMVIVNGRTPKKSPALFRSLLPGTYTVRVARDASHPFEAQMVVRSGGATVLENIPLFRNRLPALLEDNPLIQDAVWQEGSEAVAWMTRSSGWSEVWLKKSTAAPPLLLYRTAETAPIVLQFQKNILLVEEKESRRAFALSGAPVDAPEMPVRLRSSREITTVEDAEGHPLLTLPRGAWRFAGQKGEMILLEERGAGRAALVLPNDVNPLVLFMHADQLAWNQNGDLLFASEYELIAYDADTHQMETLQRSSEPIHSMAWHPNGQTIFYAAGDTLFAKHLSAPPTAAPIPLLTGYTISGMSVEKEGKRLAFLGISAHDRGLFVLGL